MTAASIARCAEGCDGGAHYRHSETDETLFARPGEKLPFREREGFWCPLARDNIEPAKKQQILIGRGLMWISEGGPLVRGGTINIICDINEGLRGGKPIMGCYRVTESNPLSMGGKTGVHIQIELIGEMDLSKLALVAGLYNC